MVSSNSSQYNTLKGVIPPVEVYAGAGNAYETSLKNHMANVQKQNELNNQHGGDTTRPTKLVIPQAPTGGMQTESPNTANSVSKEAYQTLMNSFVNAQYDSLVKVPPVPDSNTQSGGSLLHRLKRLVPKKSRKTKRGRKTKKGGKTKQYRMKRMHGRKTRKVRKTKRRRKN